MILSVMLSCSYTGIKEGNLSVRLPESEVMVMESNHFQWLLQDYTVWNRAVYTIAEIQELYTRRAFAIAELPFPADSIKKYSIKDIINKKKYFIELKYSTKKKSGNTYYSLTDENNNIIAKFNKVISDDYLEYSIAYNDTILNMRSKKIDEKDADIEIAEITDTTKNITYIRKEMDYFSDRLEFDIKMDDSSIEKILYVAAALVFDDILKDKKGDYK